VIIGCGVAGLAAATEIVSVSASAPYFSHFHHLRHHHPVYVSNCFLSFLIVILAIAFPSKYSHIFFIKMVQYTSSRAQ
jgi:hypothetical protein